MSEKLGADIDFGHEDSYYWSISDEQVVVLYSRNHKELESLRGRHSRAQEQFEKGPHIDRLATCISGIKKRLLSLEEELVVRRALATWQPDDIPDQLVEPVEPLETFLKAS